MHVSDPHLADLLAHGDRAALAELFDRYGGIAYGLAHRVTRDDELAADAVRRAFATVSRGGARPHGDTLTLYAWLIAITHREAVAVARAARARAGEEIGLPEPLPLAGRGSVGAVLDLLPGRDREVIDRCYYDGVSEPELARWHDLPRTTVQTRARSALTTLRAELDAARAVAARALAGAGADS
jgi:RNA polymerase sigma-70 factor (ECF subfamily)